MWELMIILGFGVPILYFVFYSLYTQNIKIENEFARDVYYYLVRRYPETKIIDSGGLSSDPLIESRNAGPFSFLEIKVITNNRSGVSDRDMILRGTVDRTKHERGKNPGSNILISPTISWVNNSSNVEIGQSRFDNRFKTSCDNQIFARDLLLTELGEMIRHNYDLEAYSLHWQRDGNLVIQVRMETMNSNSFLHAYNIALATIGTLIEKGYLTRKGIQFATTEYPAPKIITPTISETEAIYIPKYGEKTEKSAYKEKIIQETSKPTEPIQPSIPDGKIYSTIERKQKLSTKVEENKSLFTSIMYQAKEMEFFEDSVIIHTFSTQVPKINVSFPSLDSVEFIGNANQIPKESFTLRIKNPNPPQTPSWQDQWKDIQLNGSEPLIERLKFRSAIANRIVEVGNIDIKINGTEHGILYSLLVEKEKDSISIGYSLFNDLVWFFEMLV